MRVTQTLALNELYDLMWPCHNYLRPVVRAVKKAVISEDG